MAIFLLVLHFLLILPALHCQYPSLYYRPKSDTACIPSLPTINGYFVISNETLECPTGCINCTSDSQCQSCTLGYFLWKDFCQQCENDCLRCISKQSCIQCSAGYYFDGESCKQCPENCLNCTSDACFSCLPSFYPQNRNCKKCADGCLECVSFEICEKCQCRFALGNGTCVECLSGCSQCNVETLNQCDGCGKKYYEGTRQCKPCSAGCQSCQSGQNCFICSVGYVFNNNSICSEKCDFPCQTCSKEKCESCFSGYALNGNQCLEDLSCNNNSLCVACPHSYYLHLGQCLSCQLDNCLKCYQPQQNTSLVCLKCVDSFWLQNNSCVNCPQSCKTCLFSSFCYSCNQGYYMLKQESDIISGKCQPCSSEDFCQTCAENAFSCTSCIEGYVFLSFKCVSKVGIGFQIVLDMEINNFFYQVNNFKTQLLIIAGSQFEEKKKHITLISIEGSTTISGRLTIIDQKNPDKVQEKLSAGFSSNSSVGNFTVVSSTFKIINSPFDEQPEKIVEESIWGLVIASIFGGLSCIGLSLLGIVYLRRYLREKQMMRKLYEGFPPIDTGDSQKGQAI